MTLLAGDLGGTKTLLGVYDDDGQKLYSRRFENVGYASLEAILGEFAADPALQAYPAPRRGVIGVAGPIEEIGADQGIGRQRSRVTNLPWELESERLAAAAGVARLRLVNDFYTVSAATADWAQAVESGALPASLAPLTHGAAPRPRGAIAILGAGTGLGEGIIARSTHAPLILPSEGGHADFAPRDEVEIELLRFLQRRHGGHVSYERVLCGAGLVALYEFLREHGQACGGPAESAAVRAELDADPHGAPAVVSRHGLDGTDALCVAALDRFVRVYGAEAGNLALKALATGGVFLAGGIAPKILPRLQDGAFLEAFLDKGRFRGLLATIPVYVIVHPEGGLYGAAVLARAL